MVQYTEKQRFTQPWLWAIILGVAAVFWYGAFRQLVWGEPWGTNPAGDTVLLLSWVVAGLGIPALFGFAHLRTEVRDDGIQVRFFPFHLRPRVWRWDRIARVEARDYSPLRVYGGWGIRIGARGRAYNISGSQGIELTYTVGHRLLMGTQDAEGLMRAVEQARNEYLGRTG